MTFDNPNSINGFNSGLDPSSDLSKAEQELFGQAAQKHPTALGKVSGSPGDDDSYSSSGRGATDDLTGLPPSTALGDGPLYGDEFESGIPPIDYTVYEIGKAYQKLSHAVEASQPHIKQAAENAAAHFSEELQNTIQSAKDDWNAPNNPARQFVEEQKSQLIQNFRQWWSDIQDDPNAQTIAERAGEIFKNLSKKTGEITQTAQSHTEQWSNQLFEEAYYETLNSSSDEPSTLEPSTLSEAGRFQSEKPFVGVIDNYFIKGSHGDQVAQMIERKGQQAPDWFGRGVGSGEWAESLVKFVDAAKASGQDQAVVNLSFDLTQVNPDGVVSTRHELTAEEYEALSYAHDNDVLLVVATGNQGSEMSALGKASQEFDNIVAVGAIEQGQRAEYSSYGDGVGFVASGQGRGEIEGTSLAAARVTGAIAQVWNTNPDLNYQQVIQVLEESSTDLQTPGVDPYTGVGKPDVELAVELAATGYVGEGDRPDNQKTSTNQRSDLFNDDALPIPSERPAFLGRLKDEFMDRIVDPIFDRVPEPIKEPIRSTVSTVKEAVTELIDDPSNFSESLRDAASDLGTAVEGLAYPGYVFKYIPGKELVEDVMVEKWQARMQERGWNIAVDGYYGAHSAEVARQFQEEKGLTADGIVGSETWAATFSTRNETDDSPETSPSSLPDGASGTGASSSQVFRYEPGQTLTYNSDVERWQQRMRDRGWNIDVDGYYGPQSAEVARQFQKEKGLVEDGIVGRRTWETAFDTENVTLPPKPIEPREAFEQSPEPEPSTSWDIPIIRPADDPNTLKTTTVSNGIELGLASQGGYEVVYLEGHLLNRIKEDPAMDSMQNKIIEESIKQDSRYGEESFSVDGHDVVQFGGEREEPLLHPSTLEVARNELTWALRHATVKYWANVSSSGEINIEYRLYDTLDLSPQMGRGEAYNRISQGMGLAYHRLAGGNVRLQTRAQWDVTV